MSALTELEKKQIAQAEELLFSGEQKEGFAKDLFLGKFNAEAMLPYPEPPAEAKKRGDAEVEKIAEYCRENIDPAAIDRDAKIPDSVVKGLGDLGVLGMTIAPENGGQGLSQFNYCRVMEVIGGHCASTGVFVNAHHSIGVRALELFGSEQQKAKWMKPMAAGEKLAAFALTEPQAGSDAGNVRTTATPSEDGKSYKLNGEKRWITNGGIADVLTVMARTPDDDDAEGKITAFFVTPDMPGFEVLEERMEKNSIRGTATGRLKFTDVMVPKENVLGPVGKGLRVALTVLDFGRTTFGACCTGAAKFCVERMIHRAKTRRQFGKTLGEFQLVKKKIAEAAAETYAMESATYHTAALIDSGAHDYMVETAMLKVFASDSLWRIANDTLQVWGGAGFFMDQPFERIMRDARLNLVGEGANDVLRIFVAMVGLSTLKTKGDEVKKKWASALQMQMFSPKVPNEHDDLQFMARTISKQIFQLSWACRYWGFKHQEQLLNEQYVVARIGDIATELFMCSCVFSRLSSLLSNGTVEQPVKDHELKTGMLYLRMARNRNNLRLTELKANFDEDYVATADSWMDFDFAKSVWNIDPQNQ